MNVITGNALYNQTRLDDDNFVANFVARLEMLDVLLNVLRHAAKGGETEHQILIGTRGMGKTSLLRRLAISIGRDPFLSARFVPLQFREEQYNVISLDAFWRNCGESLAEWCEANGHDDIADALDRATESPQWRDPDKAADAFLGICAKLGLRPCLLLDNLDLILEGLKDRGWEFRNVLQRPDGPLVVGAATQMLQQGADREGPFYEFFHPLVLEPLSEAELLRCMHALADRHGPAGAQVKALLAKAPERVRTLYALTGGNPRILTLIYRLLERAESDTIFGDLEALLDQVTPYYKARIEEYQGNQQRAIIDAIALNWDPIMSSAIGEATGIEVTTISSHLNKLRRDGFIERVPTSGARDGYQLSERFLNIWYLMRHGTRKTKQRLRWLTIFLTKLFSAEELNQMAVQARNKAIGGRWHPDFRDAVLEACGTGLLIGAEIAEPERLSHEGGAVTLETEAKMERARQHWARGEYPEAMAICEEVIADLDEATHPFALVVLLSALLNKSMLLDDMGRSQEAIAGYEQLLRRFGDATDPSLLDMLAKARFQLGTIHQREGRVDEAIGQFETITKRIGHSDDPRLQLTTARVLLYQGLLLSTHGRPHDAIAAFEAVSRRVGADLGEIRVRARYFEAINLNRAGRPEDAMAIYNDLARSSGDKAQAFERDVAARAMLNIGSILSEARRFDAAIAVYDEIERRFGDAAEPELRDLAARALIDKGPALNSLGRYEEEIETYDEVLRRVDRGAGAGSLEQLATALTFKGETLIDLGRLDEALPLFDQALEHAGNPDGRALEESATAALLDKAFVLARLRRFAESLSAYDELLGRFDDGSAAGTKVTAALVGKAFALDELGRTEEALAVADEVERRVGDSSEPALRLHLIRARINKGFMLGKLGRHAEEIATYDAAVGGNEDPDPEIQAEVARALMLKALTLEQIDRVEEALGTYARITARHDDPDDPRLRAEVAEAWSQRGRLLFHIFGRSEEAEFHYRQALAFSPSPMIYANLIWSLIAQKRLEEAQALRDRSEDLAAEGLALIDAGIEIVRDNLGTSLDHLEAALATGLEDGTSDYFEDILWFLRIAVDQGHGDRLVEWFVHTGNAERYAPIYGALAARVRGERFLLDLNPEIRPTSEQFYKVLRGAAVTGASAPSDERKRGRRRR